jgi:hypothetical protein
VTIDELLETMRGYLSDLEHNLAQGNLDDAVTNAGILSRKSATMGSRALQKAFEERVKV